MQAVIAFFTKVIDRPELGITVTLLLKSLYLKTLKRSNCCFITTSIEMSV